MWKRRLVFNLIFFIGTLLAGVGWLSELREWRKDEKFFKNKRKPFQVFGIPRPYKRRGERARAMQIEQG